MTGAARLAGGIPGSGLLRRRDVVTAAVRRSRARRGAAGQDRIGLLDTFALPGDRERLDAVRAADPGRRWLQRAAVTTAGDPWFRLGDHEAEQRQEWVVQPALGHDDGQAPAVVRALALIASLEPLVVYALPQLLNEPQEPAPGPADELTGLMLSAAAEVSVATRDPLLRESRRLADGAGQASQVFGVAAQLDRDLRPWLLEVETDPLTEWDVPAQVAASFLDGVAKILAAAGPLPPDEAGPLRRVVPACPPALPGAEWALPRPADLELAAALRGHRPCAEPVPRPADGVRWWLLGTELVLYLPGAGDLVVLNGTGAFTWAALADGLPVDDIAGELAVLGRRSPQWWQAAVRDVLAEWVEAGAVTRAGTGQAPGTRDRASGPPPTRDRAQSLPPLRARPVRWNPDRVYTSQGSSVLTRLPSRELATWVDRALAGLRDPAPAEIAAVVEVSADGDGWRLGGTHVAPRRCASAYHLPSAVRAAVLDSAARTSAHPAFRGSALLADGAVTVVTGPASARAGVLTAWVAGGGRVLADEIVWIDDDLLVRPQRSGLELTPPYQWVDGPPAPWPSPSAPVVDDRGNLVRYRFPAQTTVVGRPATAAALIVPGGPPGEPPRPCSAGVAMATLAAGHTLARRGLAEPQAARLVAWARTVTPWQASLDDPDRLVAAIRAGARARATAGAGGA